MSIQTDTNNLGEELTQKLDIQTKLRDQQSTITTLNDWQTHFGFVPETFSVIAEQLSNQGEWKVAQLNWQDKTIELEFTAENIDITQLIIELEKQAYLSSVNIRPHNADNTWVLEAESN